MKKKMEPKLVYYVDHGWLRPSVCAVYIVDETDKTWLFATVDEIENPGPERDRRGRPRKVGTRKHKVPYFKLYDTPEEAFRVLQKKLEDSVDSCRSNLRSAEELLGKFLTDCEAGNSEKWAKKPTWTP